MVGFSLLACFRFLSKSASDVLSLSFALQTLDLRFLIRYSVFKEQSQILRFALEEASLLRIGKIKDFSGLWIPYHTNGSDIQWA